LKGWIVLEGGTKGVFWSPLGRNSIKRVTEKKLP